MSKYWLSSFLDHHDISSEESAKSALRSPTVVNDLRRFARKAMPSLRAGAGSRFTVVAGRGIDLSGQLDCTSDTCRVRQVNELFNHVWHYFDQIIVQDGVVHEINHHWEDAPGITAKRLLSHIKVLFYLRSIGAEDLVDFRIKPPPCGLHWREHAEAAGLGQLVSEVDMLAELLLKDATIEFQEDSEGTTKFKFFHPLINPAQRGRLEPSTISDISGSLSHKAAVMIVRRFIAHLTSDVVASNNYQAALGSVNKVHNLLLRKWRGVTEEDVLMNLKLPILTGLQPWDLIAIRREEGQYFENFRFALLSAVKERLNAGGTESASQIAEEIRLDVIEPELTMIAARLKAAQSVMSKKSTVGLVLGTLSTTCGLMAGLAPPIATAAGTAVAISCTGTAAFKYLDDYKDLSLNDMFFLWKARDHAPH